MIDLKTIAAGDVIVCREDMGCTHVGRRYTVKWDLIEGFYITCDAGHHSIGSYDAPMFEKYVALSAVEQYIERELGRVGGEIL